MNYLFLSFAHLSVKFFFFVILTCGYLYFLFPVLACLIFSLSFFWNRSLLLRTPEKELRWGVQDAKSLSAGIQNGLSICMMSLPELGCRWGDPGLSSQLYGFPPCFSLPFPSHHFRWGPPSAHKATIAPWENWIMTAHNKVKETVAQTEKSLSC